MSTENRIAKSAITLNAIKTAENLTTSRVLHLIYTPSANANFVDANFRDISFISYKPTITFTATENRPTGITSGQFIPIKIFSFISITTAGNYIFKSLNRNIKVYLNNFLIIDSTKGDNFYPQDTNPSCNEWAQRNPSECVVNPIVMQDICLNACSRQFNHNGSLPIFLPVGTYNLYIEVIVNQTNDPILNLEYDMIRSGQQLALKSINTLLSQTTYTIIKNAINSKNTSITNFCSNDTNLTSTTVGSLCHNSVREANDFIVPVVQKYCFPDSNNPKTDVYCTNMVSSKDVYQKIRDLLISLYITYITTNLPKVSTTNQDTINKSINILKGARTTAEIQKGIEQHVNDTVTTFCESYFTDDKFNPDGTTSSHLCSNIYSDFKSLPKVAASMDNIKLKYCTKIDATTKKPRYESDASCTTNTMQTGLLYDTITKRCIVNNTWQINDQFCNSLVDNNINRTDKLQNLVNSKNQYLQTQIRSIKPNEKLPSSINPQLVSYATTVYNKFNNKKLSDDLLRQNLLDYCENNDTRLLDTPCKPIYATYNTENQIVSSRNKMKDTNCQLSDNILTSNTDNVAVAENRDNCKNLVFNTSGDINTINKYNNTVNTYCSTGENIINDTCKTYYNDIEKKLLDTQFPNLTVSSGFTNPAENVEIDSFENKESEESNWHFQMVLILLFITIFIVFSKRIYKKFIILKKQENK
jgi:hypothetical protein